jgi:hypothetical protein
VVTGGRGYGGGFGRVGPSTGSAGRGRSPWSAVRVEGWGSRAVTAVATRDVSRSRRLLPHRSRAYGSFPGGSLEKTVSPVTKRTKPSS